MKYTIYTTAQQDGFDVETERDLQSDFGMCKLRNYPTMLLKYDKVVYKTASQKVKRQYETLLATDQIVSIVKMEEKEIE